MFRMPIARIGISWLETLAVNCRLITRQAALPAQGIAQHKFYLGIQTAQVVVGPTLHCCEVVLVDSQSKCFALGHNTFNLKARSRL